MFLDCVQSLIIWSTGDTIEVMSHENS